MRARTSVPSIVLAGAAFCILAPQSVLAAEPAFSAEQIEFFEKKIRPVLAENCYDCHGSHRHENGLRLDSRGAILRGSDYGQIVAEGNPAGSKLLKALKHEPGVEAMPKKAAKLSDAQIADFEKWVTQGLPWPEEKTPIAHAEPEGWRKHWAFQPVKAPDVPSAKTGVQLPVDAIVAVRQAKAGLDFAPAADRRTLGRRLYVTLTGLLPAHGELEAFVNDPAIDAPARLIDKLLSSPQYGARWARHWLDVARYSDTEGYRAGDVDIRYPHAYTYRDWVINALNEDLPYDQFIAQQLAADRLTKPGEMNPALAAMGFLTVNDSFQGDKMLQTDDRIDVVTRGFLGLTVSCARCHDHKFDPIPTKDYYALYSVFTSSEVPDVFPIVGRAGDKGAQDEYNAKVAEIEKEKEKLREEVYADMRKGDRLKDYLVFVRKARDWQNEQFRGEAGKASLRDRLANSWKELVNREAFSNKPHPVMLAWNKLAPLADNQFEAQAPAVIAELVKPDSTLNPVIKNELAKRPAPKSFEDVARLYSDVFLTCLSGTQPENADWQGVKKLLLDNRSPMSVGIADMQRFFTQKDRLAMTQIENKINRLDLDSPGAPQRAMVMQDREKHEDVRVMIRGNPGRRGDPAPRGNLTLLGGQKFGEGSGRLELARLIGSKENPLTARVMVNRVWMHHFGKPLVDQTSDFGVQTPAPEQLALLDYLSARFMEEGWSLKSLHRMILNSRTYQQSAVSTVDKDTKDPENALLTRFNRQRMDYESMRDTMLQVSGALQPDKMGGRSVKLNAPEVDTRRSVYLFVDRFSQATVPAMFDFANPDTHSPQRSNTTVPQQALFLMNSPFAKEQSDKVSATIPVEGSQPDAKTITALFQKVLLRSPSPEEMDSAAKFLIESRGMQVDNPYRWDYGHGQVQRREEGAPVQVEGFTPFATFIHSKEQGTKWQPAKEFPHKELGYVGWNRAGAKLVGHTGRGATANIIRWVAPVDATIRIGGQLQHGTKAGDGIRGWIISSQRGILKEQALAPGNGSEMSVDFLEIKAGEVIDFCVTCEANDNSDSFSWTPRIERKDSAATGYTLWTDAGRDFAGSNKWPLNLNRPQGPLSQLAHVLMMSNEYQFID